MARPVTRSRLPFASFTSFAFASALLVATVAVAGCGDLKTAPAANTTATDPTDPTEPTARSGPGTHGSLPSGYCCTDDSECRDRHCVETGNGGGKMCEDACRSQSTCERRDLAFQCSAQAYGDEGWCQPPSASFTCLPQAGFERGARAAGECCEATGDGNAGEECDGNRCVAVDEEGQSNPFVCSHWCDRTKDCPSGMICSPFNSCVPANRPYTCQ